MDRAESSHCKLPPHTSLAAHFCSELEQGQGTLPGINQVGLLSQQEQCGCLIEQQGTRAEVQPCASTLKQKVPCGSASTNYKTTKNFQHMQRNTRICLTADKRYIVCCN